MRCWNEPVLKHQILSVVLVLKAFDFLIKGFFIFNRLLAGQLNWLFTIEKSSIKSILKLTYLYVTLIIELNICYV